MSTLDSRLLAKCEAVAGMRVHELAGLKQCYFNWHYLLKKNPKNKTYQVEFENAEINLRKFLVGQTKLEMV
jgi:hypothetical protein